MSEKLPTDEGVPEEPVLVERLPEPAGEAEADVVNAAEPVVAGLHEGGHDAQGHHHEHPDYLAHHFDTAEQQFDAGKLGIWLFLVQEVLFFSGLFCAFAVYGSLYPEAFRWGHQQLDPLLGFINTLVLITSSFTMAWGVRCAQLAQRRGLIVCLSLTLLGACAFLCVKYFEYKAKYDHGLIPVTLTNDDGAVTVNLWHPNDHHSGHGEGHGESHGDDHVGGDHSEVAHADGDHVEGDHVGEEHHSGEEHHAEEDVDGVAETGPLDAAAGATEAVADALDLSPAIMTPSETMYPIDQTAIARYADEDDNAPPMARTFFSLYFFMTGVHGIHIIAGIIVIGWLLWRVVRNPGNEFHADYFGPVDYVGLYWHLVDLVWIYLFPLLYLISWQ